MWGTVRSERVGVQCHMDNVCCLKSFDLSEKKQVCNPWCLMHNRQYHD